ncbi:MAG TPA: four helix bundle protein [Luteitalea sp.]|nr:four helix bundle protein [Luteitalea sp.]
MRTRRDIEDRVFELAANTVRWARRFRGAYIDRDLVRQLARSVTSIGAQLEEARAAETSKDFIHKMSVARKEAFEAHYWARLLLVDMDDAVLRGLRDEIDEVAAIVSAIRRNSRATAGRTRKRSDG